VDLQSVEAVAGAGVVGEVELDRREETPLVNGHDGAPLWSWITPRLTAYSCKRASNSCNHWPSMKALMIRRTSNSAFAPLEPLTGRRYPRSTTLPMVAST